MTGKPFVVDMGVPRPRSLVERERQLAARGTTTRLTRNPQTGSWHGTLPCGREVLVARLPREVNAVDPRRSMIRAAVQMSWEWLVREPGEEAGMGSWGYTARRIALAAAEEWAEQTPR